MSEYVFAFVGLPYQMPQEVLKSIFIMENNLHNLHFYLTLIENYIYLNK